MKWIRYLVPLVLVAVASTAYGQWIPASSRYAPTATVGPSWPQTARINRLIVAEEPAPVAAGGETIVSSGPGMPCDDCGSGGWGHGHKWGGHCKTKKHCCAARHCQTGCAPRCGWTWPQWSHGGCSTCAGAVNYSEGTLAPQPQPEPNGESIETPRRAPRTGSTEPPSVKSASRGWQWPTWSTPTWTSPQPTRAKPTSYEYRTR